MSSCHLPSGLHQSRCKYGGNVYSAADSGNDNENNKDNNVDDDDIPAADGSDDDIRSAKRDDNYGASNAVLP